MLNIRQKNPNMAPAMVTALHPYLFTKELEIGPEKKKKFEIYGLYRKSYCLAEDIEDEEIKNPKFIPVLLNFPHVIRLGRSSVKIKCRLGWSRK